MSWNKFWIVRPKPLLEAKLRLFCFPYAGVGPSAFRGWAEQADPGIEVCVIQLPGRENRLREPSLYAMKDVLPPLVDALGPLLDLPYVFYGHSMGARIAFETARALRDAGALDARHLFVGASEAPQLPWTHPPVHKFTDEELLNELHRRYGGTPREFLEDPELRALVAPPVRADVTLLETYQYQPGEPFGFGITAFAGTRDSMVKPVNVEEWRHQTTGTFRFESVDGDHFFAQKARQHLLDAIASEMQRVALNPTEV